MGQPAGLRYRWARTVGCPYCDGLVPLSPNWRLAPGRDRASGSCPTAPPVRSGSGGSRLCVRDPGESGVIPTARADAREVGNGSFMVRYQGRSRPLVQPIGAVRLGVGLVGWWVGVATAPRPWAAIARGWHRGRTRRVLTETPMDSGVFPCVRAIPAGTLRRRPGGVRRSA